ncbi:cupin domain-containing protein [Pseudomonas cavernae]|uniref:Cupin domain-containing protein n=1 Tax=Pseudomonas cavernae TaxID=2320867 RepID=A0A385YZ24_9PSED|nr:cupin domain-containing protein [Pseudomonas cavernae]AYC31580.1 cupin domain-containing protein [Pseudomonas cavernae]
MSVTRIIDFSQQQTAAEPCQPKPERLLSGSPKQTIQNHYASSCGQFNAGVWESGAGRWKVSYSEHEYCEILSGSALIYDGSGHVKVVHAGDRFVIPAGFSGIWEVLENCRKVYVMFEQN